MCRLNTREQSASTNHNVTTSTKSHSPCITSSLPLLLLSHVIIHDRKMTYLHKLPHNSEHQGMHAEVVPVQSSFGSKTPILRQIASAVALLSPVITITLMSLLTAPHRVLHFSPWWVQHSNHTHKRHISLSEKQKRQHHSTITELVYSTQLCTRKASSNN